MFFQKISLLFVVATTLQLIGLPCSTAEKVVLDVHSDTIKNWLEVTCLYNDDYNDFWVYAYPVTLTGNDDIFPDSRGFWTAGPAQHCELHYFGGPQMPVPESLTLSVYVRGKPQVLISSKFNFWEDEVDEVGTVSDSDGVGWIEKTFDLSKQRGLAFNFTLISMDDDVILLNKVTFDLGDDATTPTEPPTTTTVRPIDGQNTVVLDTNADYWDFWEESCHYVDDYAYLWAFGCPIVHEPREESLESVGFWNPCSTNSTKTCTLRFKGNSSLVPSTPDLLIIRGYVDGDSKIRVTLQPNHEELCTGEVNCWELGTLNEADFGQTWKELEIKQDKVLPISVYTINIELVPSENGMVLLDKVTLRQPDYQETSPPTQTDDPTDPTGSPNTDDPTDPTGSPNTDDPTDPTGSPNTDDPTDPTDSPTTEETPRTTTDEGEAGSGGDNSAAGIFKINWPLMSVVTIITSIFLNK